MPDSSSSSPGVTVPLPSPSAIVEDKKEGKCERKGARCWLAAGRRVYWVAPFSFSRGGCFSLFISTFFLLPRLLLVNLNASLSKSWRLVLFISPSSYSSRLHLIFISRRIFFPRFRGTVLSSFSGILRVKWPQLLCIWKSEKSAIASKMFSNCNHLENCGNFLVRLYSRRFVKDLRAKLIGGCQVRVLALWWENISEGFGYWFLVLIIGMVVDMLGVMEALRQGGGNNKDIPFI